MRNNINGLSSVEIEPEGTNKKHLLAKVIAVSETYSDGLQTEKEINENLFPIDVFPSQFKELITESQRAFNFPSGYTGLAILTAVSTAIGKSAKLKVKNAWYEFCSIYAILIGNPGTTKSHAMELPFKHFEGIDRVHSKECETAYLKYEKYQSLGKKEKDDIPDDQRIDQKPKVIKTVLHNCTSEILHQRLSDNERGCVIISDEFSTWYEGINNYSKGDQLSIYLSFWSNKSTSIDRISRPVPLFLSQPFLNIIGCSQPRILPKLFPANNLNNGFFQRILFAWPDNAEKQPINDNEINEDVLSVYGSWIDRFRLSSQIIKDEETDLSKPKIYVWSYEAKKFFYQWQKENTERINEFPESLESEVLSKFDIHFCRLSLILQIMEDYENREISLKAAHGAKKLCTYFINCSFKVLDTLNTQSKTDGLPEDKKQLHEALPDVFTTAEGVEIAESLKIPERTFKRFLNDMNLFKRQERGKYEKLKKPLAHGTTGTSGMIK